MSRTHDGPGVVPGRYEGEAVRVHVGPTPQQLAADEARTHAEGLAGRICAAAAMVTRSESQLIDLIGEFDATDAVQWWSGVKSIAHWVSWTCSLSAGAARERVRVARALRRMPTVQEAFADGRLSYSKVREVTRLVDLVDEAELCRLALRATASQLARTVAGYRTADGLRMPAELKRAVRWRTRDDGMVELTARLPAEEAAVVMAALTAAKDQHGSTPEPTDGEPTDGEPTDGDRAADPPVSTQPRYSAADALLDVAAAYVSTAPPDRSGEDRTLVVVHVAAEQLADVPAGTVGPLDRGTAHVAGVSPVERDTARRLACDATLLGAVVDRFGDVLALGRTHRLVSRAQRRALMVRDRMCQFPGCAQTRHLQAHHRVSWAAGGPTDLDNLVLLCRFHHSCVHEGGMTISRGTDAAADGGWAFRMPDGSRHRPWYGAEQLPALLAFQLDQRHHDQAARLAAVDGMDHPDARAVRPGWAGETFDLHAAVETLFGIRLPDESGQERAA